MHRAHQILVNILCGLIVAVVAGIAANSARSEVLEAPSLQLSLEAGSVLTRYPGPGQ